MPRVLLDTYKQARAHLDDDLVTPALRVPKRAISMRTPDGWRLVAVPATSNAARRDAQHWARVYKRLGLRRVA